MKKFRFISHLLIMSIVLNPLDFSYAVEPEAEGGTGSEPAASTGESSITIPVEGSAPIASAEVQTQIDQAVDLLLQFQKLTHVKTIRETLESVGIRMPWASGSEAAKRNATKITLNQIDPSKLAQLIKRLTFANAAIIVAKRKALRDSFTPGPMAAHETVMGIEPSETSVATLAAEAEADPEIRDIHTQLLSHQLLTDSPSYPFNNNASTAVNITGIVIASVIVLWGFVGALACYYQYCPLGTYSGYQPDFLSTEICIDDGNGGFVCSWTTPPQVCFVNDDPSTYWSLSTGYNYWAAKHVVGYGVAALSALGVPFWAASIGLAVEKQKRIHEITGVTDALMRNPSN